MKACIFDLDGTLTNTLESMTYSVNLTLKEMGLSQITKDQCRMFVGNGARVLIEESLKVSGDPKASRIEEGMKIYGRIFDQNCTYHVTLYEGIPEMLKALKQSGKKLYLLSNAQRIFTEYEMRALHIFHYFDGILISSEHGYKKPDLRFFEKLLDTYGISRSTAIMVGNDGICDIKGAKAAGLSTLYIRSNISPEEELPQADYRLERMDMDQVKQILLN